MFAISFLPVYLRATGGEVGATSALAPKIGPLGLVRNYYFFYIRDDCRKLYSYVLSLLPVSAVSHVCYWK